MISRPLDIASRLRPAPRNFDFMFYVDVMFLALFFILFGSRFVLAPGLELTLPQVVGAQRAAALTTAYVSVPHAGQIFTENGLINQVQLHNWLKVKAQQDKQPSLLISAGAGVPNGAIFEIASAAYAAGFLHVQEAALDPNPRAGDLSR
jgi:biopolymer transport protein ExbD